MIAVSEMIFTLVAESTETAAQRRFLTPIQAPRHLPIIWDELLKTGSQAALPIDRSTAILTIH